MGGSNDFPESVGEASRNSQQFVVSDGDPT